MAGGGMINIDVGSVIGALRDTVKTIFPGPEERAKADALLDEIARRPDEAQIELNKIEAASASIFVAGWRPFIGWVCGVALAWHYVAAPLFVFMLEAFGVKVTPPALDMATLVTLLLTMLGMSKLRTDEKIADAASNH